MTAIAHRPHPVTRVLIGVRDQLTEVAGTPVWSMDATATTTAITDVQAAEAQLAELKARLLAHATRIDLPGNTAATSTANWYAVATRTTRAAAHRAVRLADQLETHDATRAALAEGRVHVEQAQVILHALADLPTDLEPEIVEKAEEHLLAQAAHFDAKALKVLGRRILEVIDPEAADAHEAEILEREERSAAAATRLVMWDDGHGKTHGRFTLDAVTGAMLKKALFAFAAPRHRASQGPLGERKPTPERLGHAFVEMIQRYPTKRLAKTGGLNATAVVLIDLETLMGGLKAAKLDTGEHISPGAARRLACEAGIIPAVLDGRSQVLDLGRKRRFATDYQRLAKTIEAGGCEIENCDAPPGTTHAHHKLRWVDGGTTNLDDLIMICPPTTTAPTTSATP
jgi:hypothetical protein